MPSKTQARSTGTIIRGDGRGRSLGFPTANLDIAIQLDSGIYAGYARLVPDQTWHRCVIHRGPRPTFPGASATTEVHVLQFPDRDLYGKTLEVKIVTRLRDIIKFKSLPDLTTAIATDCHNALEILPALPHS